jgi:excisionase family DNA binding protein
MQHLMSVGEAAGCLRISSWTVRAWIADGKLRPVRLGRRVLLEEAELERFIALCRGQVKAHPVTNKPEEAAL